MENDGTKPKREEYESVQTEEEQIKQTASGNYPITPHTANKKSDAVLQKARKLEHYPISQKEDN